MEDASFSANLALAVMILLCIYYVVANVLCFFAYREFKGMLFDHGMGGNFGMTAQRAQGGNDRAASEDNNSGAAAGGARFAGTGQQIGSSSQGASAAANASSGGGGSSGFKSF